MADVLTDLGMAAAGVLALVFSWAGAVKLGRRAETATAFAALGLARAPALAVAVPVAELALAVTLLAAPAAGGVATLVLLAGFSVVLVRALQRGVDVPCACFGRAGGPPLSWAEPARNALLAALGLLATGAGLNPRVPGVIPTAAVTTVVAATAGLLAFLRDHRASGG